MLAYRCGRCGYVLYRGEEPLTVREVYNKYGGKCPQCNRRLRKRIAKVEITVPMYVRP